ncbi:hypothetical protein ACOSQ4_020414 [Xanthoceras sorbifolium]
MITSTCPITAPPRPPPGLSAENPARSLIAQKKLENRHAAVLETLSPNARNRVEVLGQIQSQREEVEKKYFDERSALKAKYEKLYEPYYSKRCEIVNGIVEVEGVVDGDKEEDDKATKEKGVPNFWLTAMKTNEVLAKETYPMSDDYFVAIPEKAIGTPIEWYPGKCLTQELVEKRWVLKSMETEECESFFNFFKAPAVPKEDYDCGYDTDEGYRYGVEDDFTICSIFHDEIIPRAISWFMGEAVSDSDDERDPNERYDDIIEEVDDRKKKRRRIVW